MSLNIYIWTHFTQKLYDTCNMSVGNDTCAPYMLFLRGETWCEFVEGTGVIMLQQDVIQRVHLPKPRSALSKHRTIRPMSERICLSSQLIWPASCAVKRDWVTISYLSQQNLPRATVWPANTARSPTHISLEPVSCEHLHVIKWQKKVCTIKKPQARWKGFRRL